MKKTLALAIGLGFAALAQAQTLDRTVVAPAGTTIGNPTTLSVDFTFGDLAIGSLSGTSSGLNPTTYRLTQGFHQGINTRQLARMATGEWMEMDENAIEQQAKADALAGFEMKVYPNPTHGTVNLDFSGKLDGNTQYILTDTKGQQVMSGQLSDMNAKLDMTSSEPGVYILQVLNPDSKINRTFRIVKQ